MVTSKSFSNSIGFDGRYRRMSLFESPYISRYSYTVISTYDFAFKLYRASTCSPFAVNEQPSFVVTRYIASSPHLGVRTVLGVPSPPITRSPPLISSTGFEVPSAMRINSPLAWQPVVPAISVCTISASDLWTHSPSWFTPNTASVGSLAFVFKRFLATITS